MCGFNMLIGAICFLVIVSDCGINGLFLDYCANTIECLIRTPKPITYIDNQITVRYPYLKSLKIIGSHDLKIMVGINGLRTIYTETELWIWNYLNQKLEKHHLNKIEPYDADKSQFSSPNGNLGSCIIKEHCNLYKNTSLLKCPHLVTAHQNLKIHDYVRYCMLQVTYARYTGYDMDWVNFLSEQMPLVARLNLLNITFNPNATVTAKSFVAMKNLMMLDMPDNLHHIEVETLFLKNCNIFKVETPSFIYWRKTSTVLEKYQKKVNCLSEILLDSKTEGLVHCLNQRPYANKTSLLPHLPQDPPANLLMTVNLSNSYDPAMNNINDVGSRGFSSTISPNHRNLTTISITFLGLIALFILLIIIFLIS